VPFLRFASKLINVSFIPYGLPAILDNSVSPSFQIQSARKAWRSTFKIGLQSDHFSKAHLPFF
jgi:hypothetical protein